MRRRSTGEIGSPWPQRGSKGVRIACDPSFVPRQSQSGYARQAQPDCTVGRVMVPQGQERSGFLLCRKRVGGDMVAARERSTGGEDYELPVTRSRFACRRLHGSSASRRSHGLHPLVACIALAWVRSDQWQSGAANGVTRSVATLREPALAHCLIAQPNSRSRYARASHVLQQRPASRMRLPKHPADTIVVQNGNDDGPSRRRFRVRAIDRARAVVASNSGDMP